MLSWNELTIENNFRVLIVDDNSDIHDDFRKILNPNNVQRSEKTNELYAALVGDKTENKKNL